MDKKQLAIKIIEYASALLGLSGLEVVFKTEDAFPNKSVNALFLQDYYGIVFNETWIVSASLEEVVITALHETRHAYQKANIDFPFLFIDCETRDTIEQWKKDFEDYKVPKSHEDNDYHKQSIEIGYTVNIGYIKCIIAI